MTVSTEVDVGDFSAPGTFGRQILQPRFVVRENMTNRFGCGLAVQNADQISISLLGSISGRNLAVDCSANVFITLVDRAGAGTAVQPVKQVAGMPMNIARQGENRCGGN